MALTGVETAVQAVHGYLTANLAGYIDQVNAERSGDDIVVPHLAFADVAEQQQLSPTQTPALFTMADSTSLDGSNWAYLTEQHALTVVLAASAPTAARLRRTLYRLVQATMRCIAVGAQTGGFAPVQGVAFGRPAARYSPVYTRGRPGVYFQDVQLRLVATLGEAS
jgi:hypothetical protein